MYKTFLESTVASDIAQSTGVSSKRKRQLKGLEDELETTDVEGMRTEKEPDSEEKEKQKNKKIKNTEVNESPVGSVGRTGYKDAEAYVTPALRAEFKKIVKKLGGKTVARKLLQEMNDGMI